MVRHSKLIARCAAAAVVALVSTLRAGTATIDTTGTWDHAIPNDAVPFGDPNTATYGQTFLTPDATHTFLNDFTYDIAMYTGASITVRGDVYQWDSTHSCIIGSSLFESAPFTISGTSFTPYTVSTGSLSLTANTPYVAFLTTSKDYSSVLTEQSYWGLVGADKIDHYTPGNFVYSNNGGDFSMLSSTTPTSWSTLSTPNYDLAFKMDFADTVPLPPAYLLGFVTLGLAAGIRHFTRRHA